MKTISGFFIFHPGQDGLVLRHRWNLENMKTDHQDFRISNELVIGKKLEGGSKINGKTNTEFDEIRLRHFTIEKNLKNVVTMSTNNQTRVCWVVMAGIAK